MNKETITSELLDYMQGSLLTEIPDYNMSSLKEAIDHLLLLNKPYIDKKLNVAYVIFKDELYITINYINPITEIIEYHDWQFDWGESFMLSVTKKFSLSEFDKYQIFVFMTKFMENYVTTISNLLYYDWKLEVRLHMNYHGFYTPREKYLAGHTFDEKLNKFNKSNDNDSQIKNELYTTTYTVLKCKDLNITNEYLITHTTYKFPSKTTVSYINDKLKTQLDWQLGKIKLKQNN
jgi:hypothetical protein